MKLAVVTDSTAYLPERISIHLSSGISGFIGTLYGITDEIEGVQIIPYDSKITSMPMGHMVETALDLSSQGKTVEEIISHLDTIRDNTLSLIHISEPTRPY